jgi:hypothetical protein
MKLIGPLYEAIKRIVKLKRQEAGGARKGYFVEKNYLLWRKSL